MLVDLFRTFHCVSLPPQLTERSAACEALSHVSGWSLRREAATGGWCLSFPGLARCCLVGLEYAEEVQGVVETAAQGARVTLATHLECVHCRVHDDMYVSCLCRALKLAPTRAQPACCVVQPSRTCFRAHLLTVPL